MPKSLTDVRLEKLDGSWTVFVVEDGKPIQRTFETREFAENWAHGQRMRLGLRLNLGKVLEGEAGIINTNEM